jgi:Protein of unknown function DUF262
VSTIESPTFYSDPQIRHLTQVLSDIHRGILLFPRFQRPLVWPKEMRLDLLDSVLQGVPIQTIIIWRTELKSVFCQERLGPFRMPPATEGERQYVLDGEQRLSTLYFALFPTQADPAPGEEKPGAFTYYCDLTSTSKTRFVARSDLGEVKPHHLPLTELLTGKSLTRFQRELEKSITENKRGSTEGERELDRMKELSDQVADAFRQYKLPIVSIMANDMSIVTRTFKRVNSQHVTMDEVHMVNALSYSNDFDLLERMRSIKQERLSEVGWGQLEDQVFLRVCKVKLDQSVYDENADDVAEKLKGAPQILDEAASDLLSTAAFLKDNCGIGSPALVPYAAQIILVAAALMTNPQADREERDRLRDWIWLTTYAEYFQRQMSNSRLKQLLDEARTLAQGKPLPSLNRRPVRERLERFDFRHARSRALALLLAGHSSRDATGVLAGEAHTLLTEHQVEAVPQLVTAAMVKDERWSRSPGARVLLHPGKIREFRDNLQAPQRPLFLKDTLESHIISADAHQAFLAGNYKRFVELREDDLNKLEENDFQEILGRLYPGYTPPF